MVSEPWAVCTHLRQGAQHLPGQVGVDGDDLGQRHRRVLGIAAVVGAPHVPHHRDDLLPGSQPAAGRGRVDDAGGLDTRYLGKADARAQTQPELQLRAVEAERLDADAHPAVPLGRERRAGRAGRVRQPARSRSQGLQRRPVRTVAILRPLDGPFKRGSLADEVNAGNTPTSQEPGA
jgi:hypothetical protein